MAVQTRRSARLAQNVTESTVTPDAAVAVVDLPLPRTSRLIQLIKLLVCVLGIYASYITQGIFQQILSTKTFGTGSGAQERFPHLATLNAFQSFACSAWAGSLILVFEVLLPRTSLRSSSQKHSTHPPVTAYVKPGFTNCFGPALGFQALYYIPYPAQVLAKSSKMIPVMLLGTLLHHKSYPFVEYVFCFLVTAGVSMFAWFGRGKGSHSAGVAYPDQTLLGYALCFSNLVLDGYTNVTQDAINKSYKGSTALHMMCWMNFWTGVFYLPMMFIVSSSGSEIVQFLVRYPEALRDVMYFCMCGAVGQLFIFYTIKTFGSLTNTLVTTTRKFFSILASVVWSGHGLVKEQWVAVALVFGGLLSSSWYKHNKSSAARLAVAREAKKNH